MAIKTNIDSQVNNFFKIQDLGKFIQDFIAVIFIIGSISTLLYLIWSGIEFITAGGNQDQIKSAKTRITQAIFGLTILAVVWVIWRLILYFLGLSPDVSGSTQLIIPEP